MKDLYSPTRSRKKKARTTTPAVTVRTALPVAVYALNLRRTGLVDAPKYMTVTELSLLYGIGRHIMEL
eukprot:scaffold2897_cov178-Amphora_coffeaeformis.AAC.8